MLKFWSGLKVGTKNRLKRGHLARPNFEPKLKVGPKMLKFWSGLKVGTKNRLKRGHLARPNFEPGLKVGPKRLSFEPDFGLKFQSFLSLFDQKFLLGVSIYYEWEKNTKNRLQANPGWQHPNTTEQLDDSTQKPERLSKKEDFLLLRMDSELFEREFAINRRSLSHQEWWKIYRVRLEQL